MQTATKATPAQSPARRLLDETGAAEYLKLSPRTLQLWRRRGNGPAFVKLGAAVRYDARTLDSFIEAGTRSNTSEGAGK